jgi:hypothetical protein
MKIGGNKDEGEFFEPDTAEADADAYWEFLMEIEFQKLSDWIQNDSREELRKIYLENEYRQNLIRQQRARVICGFVLLLAFLGGASLIYALATT